MVAKVYMPSAAVMKTTRIHPTVQISCDVLVFHGQQADDPAESVNHLAVIAFYVALLS